jgi:hypothetical protein
MPITTNAYLYLSGTPFRALASGEFIEEQIFNWTYSDEQQAKIEWKTKLKMEDRELRMKENMTKNNSQFNPYAALPLVIKINNPSLRQADNGRINQAVDRNIYAPQLDKSGDLFSGRFQSADTVDSEKPR